MVDFPNSPTDKQTYTEEGKTWIFRASPAPGLWEVLGGGAEQRIALSALDTGDPQGWQVWGDVLIQWGAYQQQASSPQTITFAQPFGSTPRVAATDARGAYIHTVIGLSLTSFDVYTYDNAGVSTPAAGSWIAVGEAPDNLKQPKKVSGGSGGVSTSPVEIVEADALSGWQVVGDQLIQWGDYNHPGGSSRMTYPQPFKSGTSPAVSLTIQASQPDLVNLSYNGWAHDYVDIISMFISNGTNYPTYLKWIAVGEAPDDLKKPKTVNTIGEAHFEEYHETGEYDPSWRIVGSTLEIWGRIGPGVDGTPVTLTHPRAFKRRPIVTTSMEWQSRITSVLIAQSSTTQTTFSRELSDVGGVEDWGVVTYHIIGEVA